MFSDSVIDPATIRAFRETEYRVDGDAPLALKVGTVSSALAEMHKAHRVTCSAYITACNPYSKTFEEKANADRQIALAEDLRSRSLVFINGTGQHPSNKWPGEASFLVMGLSLEEAKALGSKHEQNGIVWCGSDAVPQLILLR